MHIYLVRHTVYSNPDKVFAFHLPFHLSPEGREHASAVGRWFKDHGHTELSIFTSPIVRTAETAEIIASATSGAVHEDVRLIETACPALQGVVEPTEKSWILEEDDPTRESRPSILSRGLEILNEKIAAGKDCIFVSHGDVLTILYYHLKNQPLPKYLWGPDNTQNIVKRGSVIDVEIVDGSVASAKTVLEG